ncbi:MAG: TerC/Alx family metal homeostasis membrane protein [Acidimicrobiia bacterium]|nr:TerC/Alx family metal homeostasis membrane protein [Acidimicrobiia bacterium]
MNPQILATEAPATSNFASFDTPAVVWVGLLVLVVTLLLFDLLVVHRRPHAVLFREAMIESGVWITIGLSFGLFILWWQGGQAAGEYYAGYLIEKSLSIDNVFVWAVILSYFAVPAKYQFRVLFWGVFGALVLRAIFIFAGVALLERFDWLLYVFGAFLLFTAWRMVSGDDEEIHPEDNPILKLVRRVVPSTPTYHGQHLFARVDGRLLATPLFAVLIMVEATDVVFAVDSVPAILAVSREPFIVFSSNAFAILGLRALYFALAGLKDRFRYIDYGLAAILAFVGVKMLIANLYHIPIPLSLVVIFGLLAISIVVSLRADKREENELSDIPARKDPEEPDEM